MKKIVLIVMVCMIAVTAFGQEKKLERPQGKPGADEWVVKKREQRRSYVIEQMQLNETEKAAFIAIYDDYNKKLSASKHKMNKAMRALNDTLTDEEFTKNLDLVDAQTLEQAKIMADFYQAMKKVLPIKKVYLYYKADKEFNKLMMRDMHHGPKREMKKVEK